MLEVQEILGKKQTPASHHAPIISWASSSSGILSFGCLLYVTDKESKISFLIDSEAQVLLLPATSGVKCSYPSKFTLQAVNSLLYIHYAHIGCAILGTDFFKNFGLLGNLHCRCLRNQETHLKACGLVKSGTLRPTVAQSSEEDVVSQLIKEYPSITIPSFNKVVPSHTNTHYVETIDLPIHNRARCLAPKKSKAAKAEFQQMIKLGIIYLSKSKRSSPLHLVNKSPKYGVLVVITEH